MIGVFTCLMMKGGSMKIKWFGKLKKGKSTVYPGELTAENAQKIADVALLKRCANWANLIIEDALQAIARWSEKGYYSIYYGIYTSGKVASELTYDTMTNKMRSTTEKFIYDKLTSLGYKVEYSIRGPNQMITISWERKKENDEG